MGKIQSFLSRRGVLVALGGVAAAAAAIVTRPIQMIIGGTARDVVRSQPIFSRLLLSLADAGYNEWYDQVGTMFTVGGGATMKLVAVNAMYARGLRPANLNRSVAFVASFDVQNRGTMAGDLIYTASNPYYGPFRIFLQAPDPRQPQRMTAVFN